MLENKTIKKTKILFKTNISKQFLLLN